MCLSELVLPYQSSNIFIMLTKEQIQKLEQRLRSERIELEAQIKKLGTPPDMGDEPGFQDESEEAEEFYNQQSQAAALKEQLADIDSALLKIEKGEYGICEEGGEPIGYDLLSIEPASRMCRDHKLSHQE